MREWRVIVGVFLALLVAGLVPIPASAAEQNEALVTGLVIVEDGTPVPDVDVELERFNQGQGGDTGGEQWRQRTVTDTEGRYRFATNPGCWRVSVSAVDDEGTTATASVTGCVNARGTLELEPLIYPGDVGPETSCFGLEPTIVGTDGDDEITGTDGDDVIFGGPGDDILLGGAGNDILCGGDGADELNGGPGADRLDGGPGDDVAAGEDGDDEIVGGDGADSLFGAAGTDRLDGGSGGDDLYGGPGDDELEGGADDDQIFGGPDADVNSGGDGTDICTDDAEGNTFIDCETTPGPIEVADTGLPLNLTPRPFTRQVDVRFDAAATATVDDVFVGVEADESYGLASRQVSPSWNVTVDPDADFTSADLTIRYYPDAVPGFDESQMRILRFDEDLKLWLSVPGTQTVDTEADTVTATVSDFSVFGVFALGPTGFQDAWGSVSVTCLPPDSDVGLDVSLVIDTSGSMGSSDPDELRVAGATAFVDAMRTQDRAGVVGFSSTVTSQLDLTPLDSAANRQAVRSAVAAHGHRLRRHRSECGRRQRHLDADRRGRNGPRPGDHLVDRRRWVL